MAPVGYLMLPSSFWQADSHRLHANGYARSLITGAHTILYAEDPVRARAFFRDVLGWPNVDAGDGWLIFQSPPAEIAMHPTAAGSQRHELWLMCDDLAATRRQLEEKGVVFTQAIAEARFGLTTEFEVPGAGTIGLYQPKHVTAI